MKFRLARDITIVLVIVLVAVVALQHGAETARRSLAQGAADSAAADTAPSHPR
jgi:hypothetical protein